MWRTALRGCTAGASLAPLVAPSHCRGAPSGSDSGPLSTMVAALPAPSAAQLQLAGVSGLTGYTAGFALKKTFRVFVFTSGCIFIGLQSLAHNGLVTVHWDKIDESLKSMAELNDDGTFKRKGVADGHERLQAYLSAGLPSAASFTTGFVLGWRA